MDAPNVINIPGVGDICLVDREQLRMRNSFRRMSIPHGMRGLMETIPPPPATFTVSKNNTIRYPILGNSRVGDCFYAASLHYVQCWTGNVGEQAQFDENAVIKRYEQISGGDNGLSDSDVRPELEHGVVGPNGPYKILDWATVNPSDADSVALGMWAFCGAMWTCSLPGGWANNARPGAIWGPNAGRPVGGHAMLFTGINAKGYENRTWGIDQPSPITVTRAGMLGADPEIIVCFSMAMFDANGVAPHCGANYDQLAGLWKTMTGHALPTNPFPPNPGLDWFA
jgi:hypothetical protein